MGWAQRVGHRDWPKVTKLAFMPKGGLEVSWFLHHYTLVIILQVFYLCIYLLLMLKLLQALVLKTAGSLRISHIILGLEIKTPKICYARIVRLWRLMAALLLARSQNRRCWEPWNDFNTGSPWLITIIEPTCSQWYLEKKTLFRSLLLENVTTRDLRNEPSLLPPIPHDYNSSNSSEI